MRHSAFPTALVFAASFVALPASPAFAQNDYYFGDSDVEQGNYQIIAGSNPQGHAPYYCQGGLCRDSNGPVWAERLTPGVVPALAASQPYASLNFAVSGAHMTERGDSDLPRPTGVSAQVAQFAALRASGAITVKDGDRFFIHAGTNDLLRVLEGESPEIVSGDIVAAARHHVSVLAANGARTVVVATVQPVQYLPFLSGADQADLRAQAGQLVAATNADLATSLTALKPTLPQNTNIILVDQTAFFDYLRVNFAKLGFDDFTTACYNPETGALCFSDPVQQNRHVFFDGNHFSAAGHSLLAQWYRATLAAASGDAGRNASNIADSLMAGGDRIAIQTSEARRLMAGQPGAMFLFAAPITATSRFRDDAGTDLAASQRGGVFGMQLPLGRSGFMALSVAHLDQRVSMGASGKFRTAEWSVSGVVGAQLGAWGIGVDVSYSRPRVKGFQRDTGVPQLVATADRVAAERYNMGIKAGFTHQWRGLRLTGENHLSYTHVSINGFGENGADGLALRYDRQSTSSLNLQSSARISFQLSPHNGAISITPYLQVGNRTRLSGDTHDITSTLIDNIANSATVRFASLYGEGLNIGGGADIGLGAKVRLGLSYDRVIDGRNLHSQAASARLAIRF